MASVFGGIIWYSYDEKKIKKKKKKVRFED